MENAAVCIDCTLLKLSCKICGLIFSNDATCPKVLDCGHSLCFSCITTLIKVNPSSPACPKCSHGIRECESYSTNYPFLEACKALNNMKHSSIHICRIHSMKIKLLSKKEMLASDLDIVEKLLGELEMCLKDVDKEEVKNNIESNLTQIEENYKKILGTSNINRKGLYATVKYENCKTTPEFFEEIIATLQHGQKIYTYAQIENHIKYGEVSLENNMILFHTLCLPEVPEKSSLIEFSDLKKYFDQQNFGLFLKLCCNEKGVIRLVALEMMDSPLISQFIKLCTGECGISYKGSTYTKGGDCDYYCSTLMVDAFKHFGEEAKGKIDYYLNFSKSLSFNNGSLVVQGIDDGTFRIVRLTKAQTRNDIVAKVSSPLNLCHCLNFANEAVLKIVDCGLLRKY